MSEVIIKRADREYARWKSFRFVLGRLAKPFLVEAKTFVPDQQDISYYGAYELLAMQRADEFQFMDPQLVKTRLQQGHPEKPDRFEEYAKLSSHPGVRHGFSVVAHILSRAPEAYVQYCEQQGTNPDINELATILRHPLSRQSTANFLANMLPDTNFSWERALQLDLDAGDKPEPRPNNDPGFAVMADEEGVLYLGIHYSEETNTRLTRFNEGGLPCPASQVFIPKLWDMMLEDCLITPELFPADLARLTDRVQ